MDGVTFDAYFLFPAGFESIFSTFCGIRPDPSIHFFFVRFLRCAILWMRKKVSNDSIGGTQWLPRTQSATDILHTIVRIVCVKRIQRRREKYCVITMGKCRSYCADCTISLRYCAGAQIFRSRQCPIVREHVPLIHAKRKATIMILLMTFMRCAAAVCD